jgi:membrane-bound serine protease (ClpP class)
MRKRVLFLIWFLVSLSLAAIPRPAAAQESRPLVLVLTADGTVAPAMAEYVGRGIRTAENNNAELVVLQLNTPGGSLGSMEDITQNILNSKVPVVVYVTPRGAMAASAGTLILLSAHAAAMAPESATGAASPIDASGQNLSSTLQSKEENFLKAQVRDWAKRRGENVVAMAEQTIDSARAISASEAVQTGFVDFYAVDLNDLLRQLDGFKVTMASGEIRILHTAGAQTENLSLSLIERLLTILTDPNIVFLLLDVGVIAILIEISSPGGWVAGFTGVVMLALATYGMGILNVNWFGLIFLVMAFVLFIVDIKAPSHGALTIAGTGSLIVGALVLFNSPGTPRFQHVSVPLVFAVSLTVAATFFVVLTVFIIPAHRTRVLTGQNTIVGQVGIVRTDLTPRGNVQVGGELWSARPVNEENIPAGTRVKVVGVEGLQLRVQTESQLSLTTENTKLAEKK